MKMRLDSYLVKKGFYISRERASEAIKNGIVFVDGNKKIKPAFLVDENNKISCVPLVYVSRAEQKLEHAINIFKVVVKDKIALDVGASTGGFTNCLLKNGAKLVFAVDVGRGQLEETLKNNRKVVNLEKTNFLNIADEFVDKVDLVVIDVSFVSILKFLDKLKNYNCDIVILIKPQFECGKTYAKKHKGIIKDNDVYYKILSTIIEKFENTGLICGGLVNSPILGGEGNREFLAIFKRGLNKISFDIKKIVEKI